MNTGPDHLQPWESGVGFVCQIVLRVRGVFRIDMDMYLLLQSRGSSLSITPNALKNGAVVQSEAFFSSHTRLFFVDFPR